MVSPSSKALESEILVCGSDARALADLRRLIGAHGYSVEAVRTPVGAIQRTRGSSFRAVVFLLDKGDETWLETITAFNDLFPDLPVIVLASHASLETERQARQRKIFYYLLHPADSAEIRAVLKDATAGRNGC